jgi:hypothetical protein
MPKYHITKGTIKDHDGKPVPSGDSVLPDYLLAQLADKETSDDIELEKGSAKKAKLKEAKFLAKLDKPIKKDDRKTATIKKSKEGKA